MPLGNILAIYIHLLSIENNSIELICTSFENAKCIEIGSGYAERMELDRVKFIHNMNANIFIIA